MFIEPRDVRKLTNAASDVIIECPKSFVDKECERVARELNWIELSKDIKAYESLLND